MFIADLEIFQYIATLDAPVSASGLADHFCVEGDERHNFDLRISNLAHKQYLYAHKHSVNNKIVVTYSLGGEASNAMANHEQTLSLSKKDQKNFIVTTVVAAVGAISGLASLLWLIWSTINPPA